MRLQQPHRLDRMRVACRVLQRVHQVQLGIGRGNGRRIALPAGRLFFQVEFFASFSPKP